MPSWTPLLSATVALVLAPAAARAEGYVNPWAGVNFGSQVENGRGGFGVTAGAMGAGIVGVEATFGFNPSRTINGNLHDSFDFEGGDLHYWRGAIGIVVR